MTKSLFFGAFLITSVLCSSCETVVINHGSVVESSEFKKVKPGKDDVKSVYSLLGSPTMRSSVKSEDGSFSWYYVSKRTEKTSFLSAKVVDQKTCEILFDKNGIVRSMEESSYEKPVESVSKTTQTEGKTDGIMGETFGGLGKYMKKYSDADKKK